MPEQKNNTASSDAPKGAYQVLARRYRSRTFDEIIGQEPIVRTLRNAIARDRTAHAYLFCGTRGVGKTSAARIFAIELARHTRQAAGDGALDDAVVDAIFRGEDIDIVEIDGASHNSVQEARELISNANLMPARLPLKLYIIDEVHMLSTSAFNALLKTMEEPPAHVKFVLCTTEPQKVPQTIQSRCQRFDFRSISDADIAGHLETILNKESISFTPEAPVQVARLADGSMRDALTLLDRVVAACDDGIDEATLQVVLGLPDETLLDALVAAIGQRNGGATIEAAEQLLENGVEPGRVLDLLAERLRRVLVASSCDANAHVLRVSPEAAERARAAASAFDSGTLVQMIVSCDAGSRQVRSSGASRALLDAVLVRLCLLESFASAAGLLAGTPPPGKGAARVH